MEHVKGVTEKIPCAFWTSCCPRHLNDGDASCPCVSSDDLLPPLPPQLAGRTLNFRESYGNLQEVEKVNAQKFAKSNSGKKNKKTWNVHHNRGCTVKYCRLICYDMKLENWKIKLQAINT